jgi:1-acyl-sn-glycerol-3-phosphate acyltransferase
VVVVGVYHLSLHQHSAKTYCKISQMITISKLLNAMRLAFSTLAFIIFPFYKISRYVDFLTRNNRATIKISKKLDSNKNYIIIANHRSWYDFFYLRDFLYKKINLKSCTGMHKDGIGYKIYSYALKRKCDFYFSNLDKSVISKNIQLIQAGYHCMLFPEGTRNKTTAGLLPFKKGIDKIISSTDTDILLINIQGTANILRGLNTSPTIEVSLLSNEESKGHHVEDLYRAVFNC